MLQARHVEFPVERFTNYIEMHSNDLSNDHSDPALFYRFFSYVKADAAKSVFSCEIDGIGRACAVQRSCDLGLHRRPNHLQLTAQAISEIV